MKTITFCKNWNGKLDKPVFTTIRSWTPIKEEFYKNSIGKTFNVFLEDIHYCSAILISTDRKAFSKIDKTILIEDTGESSSDKINEIFKRFHIESFTEVMILSFERLQ